MTYAVRYPTEVASLWLLDPAGVWSVPQSELQKTIAETGCNQLMVKSGDDFEQLVKFAMYNPQFISVPMLNVMAQERISNYALEERIFKQILYDSVEKRINGLPIPALIVRGDEDRVLSVALQRSFTTPCRTRMLS